jgi:hypothetical protein
MICLLFALVGLSACGGGGSSETTPTTPTTPTPPTTPTSATGKFVDAPVEGLKYVSGGQSGFTGANGEFTYEIGQSVTFSVGGVVVGQAPGASVITPIELVKTAAPGTISYRQYDCCCPDRTVPVDRKQPYFNRN